MTFTPAPKPAPREKKPRKPLPRPTKPIARYSWLAQSTKPIRQLNPEAKARRDKAFRKFLGSALWKRIRMATFEANDFACVDCGWEDETRTGLALIADHETYARWGGQEIVGEDVVTRCRKCNERITVERRANWAQGRRR